MSDCASSPAPLDVPAVMSMLGFYSSSPTGQFEMLAEAFYAETGMTAPGQSAPAEAGGYSSEREAECREKWRSFVQAEHAVARKLFGELRAALSGLVEDRALLDVLGVETTVIAPIHVGDGPTRLWAVAGQYETVREALRARVAASVPQSLAARALREEGDHAR